MSDPLIGADPAAAVAVRAISACLMYSEWEDNERAGTGRPTMGPDCVANAAALEVWHHNRVVLASQMREAMPPYPAALMVAAGEICAALTIGNGYCTPLNWRQFLALCADYVAAQPSEPEAAAPATCGCRAYGSRCNESATCRCGWCGVALCDLCAEGHLGGPYSCGAEACELARGSGELPRFVTMADACAQCGLTLNDGRACGQCPRCDAWVHCTCLEHHGRRAHGVVGMGEGADVTDAMEGRR